MREICIFPLESDVARNPFSAVGYRPVALLAKLVEVVLDDLYPEPSEENRPEKGQTDPKLKRSDRDTLEFNFHEAGGLEQDETVRHFRIELRLRPWDSIDSVQLGFEVRWENHTTPLKIQMAVTASAKDFMGKKTYWLEKSDAGYALSIVEG